MEIAAVKTILEVTSPAFDHEGFIPKEYSCDGPGYSPELNIGGLPLETKSLAIIVEDPDAPKGLFTHWLVWNVPPADVIQSNSKPGQEAVNSAGTVGYTPPCPPSGTHRYYFKVYALDTLLDMRKNFDKTALEQEISEHVIAYGELMGRFKSLRENP